MKKLVAYSFALLCYAWGAVVCWLAVGCSSAAIDRTVSTIDPYQTCLLAARLSPRTPEIAAKSGMTAEQWSESVCRIAEGLVGVAESIASSACIVPNRAAGVAGGPSWP